MAITTTPTVAATATATSGTRTIKRNNTAVHHQHQHNHALTLPHDSDLCRFFIFFYLLFFCWTLLFLLIVTLLFFALCFFTVLVLALLFLIHYSFVTLSLSVLFLFFSFLFFFNLLLFFFSSVLFFSLPVFFCFAFLYYVSMFLLHFFSCLFSGCGLLLLRWVKYLYVLAAPIIKACSWPQIQVSSADFVRLLARSASGVYGKVFTCDKTLPPALKDELTIKKLKTTFKSAGTISNQRSAAATAWVMKYSGQLNKLPLCCAGLTDCI